jgi:STE24 endopeptidase
MNFWLISVLVILAGSYLLEFVVSILNISALQEHLPAEFADCFDKENYRASQQYTRETTVLSLAENGFSTFCTIVFILLGGFNYVDIWARNFQYGQIATGLIFTAVLLLLSFCISLPFSLYGTFVIEQKFGFNRTTVSTFILDIVKTISLTAVLGGPLLAAIFWFFINSGSNGWLYCWLGVVIFTLVMQFVAPVLIMPLYNRFSPLEPGPLHDDILQYANKENFKTGGIFTMDGSKRSSKLNAFFTGFGRFRKIVFYDTLMEKLTIREIIAVLAHEMGHYKLRHIPQMMVASIVQTGIMFFLLSLFVNLDGVGLAFKMEKLSVYSSLVFFGFLYSPINLLVSIFFNYLSRKNEFDADHYAVTSTGEPDQLVLSLKKLGKANLSNLTPHPFHVFLHYSHPPLSGRIDKIQKAMAPTTESWPYRNLKR